MSTEAPKSDTGSITSDPLDSSRSSFNNCWECMADYFSRIWTCISDACCSAWQWLSDLFEGCCCPGRYNNHTHERHNDVRRRRSSPDGGRTRTYLPSPPQARNISPPSQSPSDNQTEPKQSKTDSPSQAPKPSSPTSILKNRPQSNSNLLRQQSSPQEPTLPEPPRIDFVETGSIFGDRKKTGIDHTMLQIENGRFRSPGLSKVIPGPNGRQIRVSFVSGFPSIKSIESRNSLASAKVWSKRSTETVTPAGTNGPNSQTGPSVAIPSSKSSDSVKGKKVSMTIKSVRSLKSTGSNESRDGEMANAESVPSNKQAS